jgi:catechol 2,3-dioxygenase-like lactoylglutathione lyase family enzyme
MAIATGISHAALVVTDVERAKDFYVNFLGLREIPRPARVVGRIPGAWLECESGHQVHLIGDADAKGIGDTSNRYRPHLALHVDDFDGSLKALDERGITYRAGELDGARTASFDDPDGNSIELTTR